MSEYGRNERETRDLYADDPHVSPYLFGMLLEDAQARDRAFAANEELIDRWTSRDDQDAEGEL